MSKPKEHPAGTVQNVLAELEAAIQNSKSPVEQTLAHHLRKEITQPRIKPDIDLAWNHTAQEQE